VLYGKALTVVSVETTYEDINGEWLHQLISEDTRAG
jgi:hypothetical protein